MPRAFAINVVTDAINLAAFLGKNTNTVDSLIENDPEKITVYVETPFRSPAWQRRWIEKNMNAISTHLKSEFWRPVTWN